MHKHMILNLVGLIWPFLFLIAGEADVLKVNVSHQGNGSYLFEVTVAHADN